MSLTPEFIEMLRGGIGTRTQNQFAKETGLTPEYISRLLNGKTDVVPRMSTLEKISTHTSRYGLNDYLKALGQEPVDPTSRLRTDTIAFDRFLKAHIGENGDWKDITTDVLWNTAWPVSGVLRTGIVAHTPPELRSEFGDTYFHLFQYQIPDREYFGVIYFILTTEFGSKPMEEQIDALVINPEAIDPFLPFTLFGTTEHIAVRNTIIYPMTGDEKEQNEMRKEIDRSLGTRTSAEDRLLQAIFGKSDWRLKPVIGFGFKFDKYVLDETSEFGRELKIPDKFRSFMFHHAGSFCRTEEEIELFHKLLDTDEDPKDIFFEYHGEHARKFDDDDFDCCGAGAAVATVLSREYQGNIPGGFRFIRTPENADPKQPGYILICPNDGEDYEDTDITMKEILPVFTAAKELGISTFGACQTFEKMPELKKTKIFKTDAFHLEF